jgi:predicted nucleic acid-binding protein
MEWLKRLRGKIVGLDTAPLIYFIGKHPDFHPRVRPFFLAMQRGDFEVVTSTMAITEVLVHPIQQNNAVLTATYRDILQNADHLRTVPFTADIAETAARLRAEHKIRTPDAIQAATAIVMKADFFLTNDFSLSMILNPTILVLENLAD